MRTLIAVARLLTFVFSSGFIYITQKIMLALSDGTAALVAPRWYHAFLCKLFGIKVIVKGQIENGPHIVYAGNHISYLDIEVVGSLLLGCFIAKKELRDWPLFGTLSTLQRTIFISRNPVDAAKVLETIDARLEHGIPLIVFPEGTSSNGTSILSFKSSIFEMFLKKDIKIQPFTLSLLEMDGKPVKNSFDRDRYAWYGDMTLEPHLWSFAKSKGAVVQAVFEPPIPANQYNNRKQLSHDVMAAVAKNLIIPEKAEHSLDLGRSGQ